MPATEVAHGTEKELALFAMNLLPAGVRYDELMNHVFECEDVCRVVVKPYEENPAWGLLQVIVIQKNDRYFSTELSELPRRDGAEPTVNLDLNGRNSISNLSTILYYGRLRFPGTLWWALQVPTRDSAGEDFYFAALNERGEPVRNLPVTLRHDGRPVTFITDSEGKAHQQAGSHERTLTFPWNTVA